MIPLLLGEGKSLLLDVIRVFPTVLVGPYHHNRTAEKSGLSLVSISNVMDGEAYRSIRTTWLFNPSCPLQQPHGFVNTGGDKEREAKTVVGYQDRVARSRYSDDMEWWWLCLLNNDHNTKLCEFDIEQPVTSKRVQFQPCATHLFRKKKEPNTQRCISLLKRILNQSIDEAIKHAALHTTSEGPWHQTNRRMVAKSPSPVSFWISPIDTLYLPCTYLLLFFSKGRQVTWSARGSIPRITIPVGILSLHEAMHLEALSQYVRGRRRALDRYLSQNVILPPCWKNF